MPSRVLAAIAKAAAARRFVKVIAGQHASCAMWRPPWRTRSSRNPRQRRRRETPGAVPERHRELVPHAGLTGNARSATGAQCRSRGPCYRAMARQRTADRGQCVSARGRNSNVGSAESASFAAWIRRERWAGQGVRSKCDHPRQGAQGTGGRATGNDIAARGGRCPRRIAPTSLRARRKGLAHGQATDRAAIDEHQGRRASGTTGARNATVRHHHSKGLRFCARCTRAASWTVPKQCQCHAGTAPLQARRLPISEPRDAIASIYPGVDTASFYLWVRADGRGTARRECSGTAVRPIAAVGASGAVVCTALDL